RIIEHAYQEVSQAQTESCARCITAERESPRRTDIRITCGSPLVQRRAKGKLVRPAHEAHVIAELIGGRAEVSIVSRTASDIEAAGVGHAQDHVVRHVTE